jgi:lysophospholipase L1-like esterase
LNPRTRAREWASRALLVLLSVLIFAAVLLAAGEAYFRLRWGVGRRQPGQHWITFHEDRGWALVPGNYERFLVGELREVWISVNSLGLREREVTLAVPPGRRRITVAGDSFTFGQVLDAEERFTDQLQALTGEAVEIVNVSAPGYGTGQEYLFIRELTERGYEVGEKVIIAFFANDVLDNLGLDYGEGRRVPRVPVFGVDEGGELVHVPPVRPPPREPGPKASRPLARRVAGWFRNRAVVRYLQVRAVSLAGRYPWIVKAAERCGVEFAPDRTPALIVAWYTDGWEERWATTEGILEYVTREGRFGTAEVILVYVPSALQVERTIQVLVERFSVDDARYAEFLEDQDRPQRSLRRFCDEHDVPLIDATAALREASREDPAYYLREGHLNAFGSKRLADEIHRWLVARGDLPGREESPRSAAPVPASGGGK